MGEPRKIYPKELAIYVAREMIEAGPTYTPDPKWRWTDAQGRGYKWEGESVPGLETFDEKSVDEDGEEYTVIGWRVIDTHQEVPYLGRPRMRRQGDGYRTMIAGLASISGWFISTEALALRETVHIIVAENEGRYEIPEAVITERSGGRYFFEAVEGEVSEAIKTNSSSSNGDGAGR